MTIEEAFRLVKNLDWKETHRRYAPQYGLLQFNCDGEVVSVYRYKKMPHEPEQHEALSRHPRCLQISTRPDSFATPEDLRARIVTGISVFARMKPDREGGTGVHESAKVQPTPESTIALEYVRSFLEMARREFDFLTKQGFRLVEEAAPKSTSYRDGFHLRYVSNAVEVVVDYYSQELIPIFRCGGTGTNYYFIDQCLFANASGYAGAMFPLRKLEAAITKIASDIREHYGDVLAGDATTWATIRALLDAPPVKKSRLP